MYIHERKDWPDFFWETREVIYLLGEVRHMQGRLIGKMESLGFELRDEALFETITLDVLKSAEIEGELYHPDAVRSSIASRLGLEFAGTMKSDRHVDGMVEMMIDATQNCFTPLTKERLFDWHAALFPTGGNGISKIVVADWRKDLNGKMQVVSGRIGKEKVHFEAPAADLVEKEMDRFIQWYNNENMLELVMKSAIAHLWFVTIHPFQDGNGRIARALTDMLLARADKSNQRFYSLSAQIRLDRSQYYHILEKTQKGSLDVTAWMTWFLECLMNALMSTDQVLINVVLKGEFWRKHTNTQLNDRQKKILNQLVKGFDGKLTSMKWSKIAKCSKDTAVRDINDLVLKNVLQKQEAGGRSTSYELIL
jgi:Fic family protein